MADEQTPPQAPETSAARIERLLEKRPPLPPEPVDARWSWTKQKLKAVYLEAFTESTKADIAEAVGIDAKTLYKWRRAPDYRRYLATLIAADGLADRAQRVKARKTLADTLGKAIAEKLKNPSALAGEKLSSLLRAQREMLDALEKDATALQELGEEQDSAARAGKARPALDMGERLAQITDPHERDIVKRHLLAMMSEYLDAPKIMDAETVSEPDARAVAEPSAPARALDAPQSSPQDLNTFTEEEPTTHANPPTQATPSAPSGTELDASAFD